jgi:hypothetical protein
LVSKIEIVIVFPFQRIIDSLRVKHSPFVLKQKRPEGLVWLGSRDFPALQRSGRNVDALDLTVLIDDANFLEVGFPQFSGRYHRVGALIARHELFACDGAYSRHDIHSVSVLGFSTTYSTIFF